MAVIASDRQSHFSTKTKIASVLPRNDGLKSNSDTVRTRTNSNISEHCAIQKPRI